MWLYLELAADTYIAGLGFDARHREDTLLLLDLVAVFPIDILWDCAGELLCYFTREEKTYSSLNLSLQGTFGELVHCTRDLTWDLVNKPSIEGYLREPHP